MTDRTNSPLGLRLPAFRLNDGDQIHLDDLGVCEVFDVALVNTRIELVLIDSNGFAHERVVSNSHMFDVDPARPTVAR